VAVTNLTKALDDAGAAYEVLHHEHTERATAEAIALGVSPDEVAKTLIVATPTGHVRALVPASRRIDMRKLADALGEGRKQLHLSTEEEMRRDYPEFELGAVPPLGGASTDAVIVDSALARLESIVFEAGSHDDSVRINTADLLRLTGARVDDIARDDEEA
jgi:Ala-tRNA(Pro) deacylase